MPLSRIALVEEDRETRDLIELVLAGYDGYDVGSFDRGYEALRALAVFRPDLVLIDVAGSHSEAIELFYRLTDEPELRDVPIVFLTGDLFAHETRRLSQRAPILTMPFEPGGLAARLEAIHAAVGGRDGVAPLPISLLPRGPGAGRVH